METEEQMARRLGSAWTQKFGWEYDADTEAEINKIMQVELNKEILREIRRLDKATTVTDKIRRLPNK